MTRTCATALLTAATQSHTGQHSPGSLCAFGMGLRVPTCGKSSNATTISPPHIRHNFTLQARHAHSSRMNVLDGRCGGGVSRSRGPHAREWSRQCRTSGPSHNQQVSRSTEFVPALFSTLAVQQSCTLSSAISPLGYSGEAVLPTGRTVR
jgi:hypothetical protein